MDNIEGAGDSLILSVMMPDENSELKEGLLTKDTGDITGIRLNHFSDSHAHGDITFRGITRVTKAKFIRIRDRETAIDAWTLMRDKWKINVPSLIISVTGAATDFTLSEKLSESFKSTILKASRLTNAFIITGGKYGGVTRLVSDALEKSDVEKSSGFSCMGVANWDKIMHKDIIAANRPYVIGSWLTQKSLNLDYKHTHFLLVKDVGRKDTECLLRGSLERYIVEKYKAPAVRVILNGGVNVLNSIYELVSLPNCYPIVIVQKSGRIADVIAYALRNHEAVLNRKKAGMRHDELWLKARDVLYEKYGPLFGGNDVDAWFEVCYERLLFCLEKKDMFVLTDKGDVDAAVMRALLTGLTGTESEAFEKMKLTLLWDRADYARANIFKSSLKVRYEDLKYMMVMSLARANHEYAGLLMDYGVNMHELLTVGILEFLYGYQAQEDGSPLKNEFHVADFKVVEGVGISEADTKYRKSLKRERIKEVLNNYLSYGLANDVHIFNVIEEGITSKESAFQDPFWELFMWALICNLPRMALFFWPFGNNQMAKALIAAEIWKHMAHQDDIKEETRVTIIEGSKSFASLACRLLEQCYSSHVEKTTHIVTTTLPNLTDTNCLDLAAVTYSYEYVANSSIQNLLDDVWTGKMKTKKQTAKYYAMLLLNMIIPFHIFSLMVLPREKNKDGIMTKPKAGRIMSGLQKIATFHLHTPVVTYLWHIVGYMLSLCVYSYHITMTKVHGKMHNEDPHAPKEGTHAEDYSELFMVFWVIGHLMDAFYHMSTYNVDTYLKKFLRWFSDGYHKCDLVNIICFFIAWGMNFHNSTRPYAHTLHAINCAFWILRVLTVLRIHATLGLYLQMILEMLNDLLWFMFILFFVILAYSIMSTSLLYPGETDFMGHLRMFLRSLFNIYGSHFLNSASAHDDSHPGPIHSDEAEGHDHYLVWIIFGFYLLFTNILLLNIIIAAFNTTYARVQASANHTSKFGKYLVIAEYSGRKVSTPPPVCIIYHIVTLVRWVYRRARHIKVSQEATKLNRKLWSVDASEREVLGEFEYFCAQQVYKGNVDKEPNKRIQQQDAHQIEALKENMTMSLGRLEDTVEKMAREIDCFITKTHPDITHPEGICPQGKDTLSKTV